MPSRRKPRSGLSPCGPQLRLPARPRRCPAIPSSDPPHLFRASTAIRVRDIPCFHFVCTPCPFHPIQPGISSLGIHLRSQPFLTRCRIAHIHALVVSFSFLRSNYLSYSSRFKFQQLISTTDLLVSLLGAKSFPDRASRTNENVPRPTEYSGPRPMNHMLLPIVTRLSKLEAIHNESWLETGPFDWTRQTRGSLFHRNTLRFAFVVAIDDSG